MGTRWIMGKIQKQMQHGWGSRIGLGERWFHLGPEGLEAQRRLTIWGDAEWGVFIVNRGGSW